MRLLPALALLLFALPASAQGMLITRPAGVALDALVAHEGRGNGETTFGFSAGAVYRGVGFTGSYGEHAAGAGITLYPIRETETGRQGTVAVGLAFSRNNQDGGFALIPSVSGSARVLKSGSVVLIPQAAAGFLIPVGGSGLLPRLTVSGALALGVGSEQGRIFFGSTMGYVPDDSGVNTAFTLGFSLGATFGSPN